MAQYISQPRIEGPIWLSPSDLSFLQTLITETETQAESLENQIKQADKDRITELTHQKDAKTNEIASLRNILSPIRRIPLEIFSEILEFSCLPFNGIFTADYNIMQYVAEVSLVCVAWRKAALDTPKLWSRICIDDDYHYPDAEEIKEWLARSEGLPLELYLCIRYWSPSVFARRMDCILESRGRIALIHLSGRPHSFFPLFCLPRASFPLLEKLTLCIAILVVGAEHGQNIFPDRMEAFFDAPKLQHFNIIETLKVSMLARLMLPLERLASFDIKLRFDRKPQFDQNLYRDTLHRCGNLVSLNVDSDSYHGLGFDTEASIYLPSLKFLDIDCWDVAPHRFTLLHGLTTPALEGLILRWADQPISDLCRDVAGLQNRSATTLSALSLHEKSPRRGIICWPSFITNDLLPILAAFPAVQSFRYDLLADQCDIDHLIQAMIYSKSEPVVFPRLTSFDVLSSHNSSLDFMVSLIHSRWSGISDDSEVARLKKVTLRGRIFSSIVTRDDFNFPGLIVDYLRHR